MSRIACIVLLFAAGCGPAARLEPPSCTGAACVGLAFATLARAEQPQPEPKKCCGKCGKNGLPPGKIRSGDGVAIIDCGCDPGCACRKPRQAGTINCPDGRCNLR